MKPITAYIVFFALLFPSIFVSWSNYLATKETIIDDMNQALAKTIQENIGRQITADTLTSFRGNLQVKQLKSTSYLVLCTDEPSKSALCSDTMSFSEWLACIIKAHPNGYICGSNTTGVLGRVAPIPLISGISTRITGYGVYMNDASCTFPNGLPIDIVLDAELIGEDAIQEIFKIITN